MIIKLFFVLSLIALFSILMTNDADASHFTILIPQDDHISGIGKNQVCIHFDNRR